MSGIIRFLLVHVPRAGEHRVSHAPKPSVVAGECIQILRARKFLFLDRGKIEHGSYIRGTHQTIELSELPSENSWNG